MAIPRSRIVDETRSGEYHCWSRCVRKAHLLSSPNDHRRHWFVERIRHLVSAFAIDTVSFAIMGNHMHLILRTLPELVGTWSDREVAYRWLLVRPNRMRRRKLGIDPDAPPQEVELDLVCAEPGRIRRIRRRLSSLSWFMKELKEPLARLANAEDGVTGRFWQDRFKCHPLLDDAALLCCATYVDMNPVTAGTATDALTAPFTSVNEHLRRLWTGLSEGGRGGIAHDDPKEAVDAALSRLDDVAFGPAIPCRREAYLHDEAVTTTGETDPNSASSEVGLDHNFKVAATRGGHSRPSASNRPRRPFIPPLSLLGMTLGAYFRRLAELSGLAQLGDATPGADHDDTRVTSSKRKARGATTQSVLDGIDTTMGSVLAVARSRRFWGTAIGSTKSLVAEAIRRRTDRVICAMRP